MANRIFALLVSVSIIGTALANVYSYDAEVEVILRDVEKELNKISPHIQEVASITADEYNLEQKMQTMRLLREAKQTVRKTADRLKAIPLDDLEDQNLARQARLLLDNSIFSLSDTALNEYLLLMGAANNLERAQHICDYHDQRSCNLAFSPDVEEVIKNSVDPDELLHYWRQVRSANVSDNKSRIKKFVDLIQIQATSNGYDVPSEYYYWRYETDQLLFFRNIVESLAEIYKLFHAHLRHILIEEYGDDVVSEKGGIPHHLFEQLKVQAWKRRTYIPTPFPTHHLPNVQARLQERRYDAQQLHKLADSFFARPIQSMPLNFWDDDFIEMSPGDCKPVVYNYFKGSKIKACAGNSMRRFLEAHATMAEVHLNEEQMSLPIAYRGDTAPGWTEAIKHAVAMAASTPRYLKNIGLAPDYTYDEFRSLNRLFRVGVRFFLDLAEAMVNEILLKELMDEDILVEEVNCRYWELMADIAGVEAPENRNSEQLDLPFSFYKAMAFTKPNSVNLFADIISFAIYEEVCIAAEAYDPNEPDLPLDNCDFSKDDQGLEVLKQFMSVGSKTPYTNALDEITSYKVSPAASIEQYFHKVVDWLDNTNGFNEVTPGWKIDKECF